MSVGHIMKPLIQVAGPDDCWEWLGAINPKTGYGKKQLGGKSVLAHRWAYNLFVGHIEDGQVIDHLCGNRSCVNPRHLEPVSQAENCRRGRTTKLTANQASEIKRRIPSLKWGGRKKLAEEYGISEALVSDIKYGRAWAK